MKYSPQIILLVDDFAAKVSQSLHLPDIWTDSRLGLWHKRLQCDGWGIDVNTLKGAELDLQDESAKSTIRKRRSEKDEKRRSTFNP